MKSEFVRTHQIGIPNPKYEAPIINYYCTYFNDELLVHLKKRDYEILEKYAYLGQIQQEEIERLNNIIRELAFIFDDYNEFNKILEKYNYELKGSESNE